MNLDLPPELAAAGVNECPQSYFVGPARSLYWTWRRSTLSGVLPYGCDRMSDLPQFMVEVFEICNVVEQANERRTQMSLQADMGRVMSALSGQRGG